MEVQQEGVGWHSRNATRAERGPCERLPEVRVEGCPTIGKTTVFRQLSDVIRKLFLHIISFLFTPTQE